MRRASYVGACSRRCVEVHNGGECGGCWRKRVGRGSVPGVVGGGVARGGVGGAGVLAPPTGAGCGVRFGRPSWRWRARTADGGWLYSEGSTWSGRFHLIGNKQYGGIGASRPLRRGLCVAWHLSPAVWHDRCEVERVTGAWRVAPGVRHWLREGVLRCRAGRLQAWAARVSRV